MEIVNIVIRGILSLITLFFITKIMGKKQASQLSLFDYVIGISIGNFLAESTINLDSNLLNGIISILLFGFVSYIVSKITMKSMKLRRFFIGVPTILISKGEIILNNLKKVKLDMNDLLQECRNSGYFTISDIEYAVMEVDGKISFLPKSINKYLTPKDMNLVPQQDELLANIIIDGNVLNNNLVSMKKNKKWLYKQLKIKGYNLDDILLATLDSKDNIIFYKENVNNDNLNILE